jgi:anti-sigma factor RsiW
MTSDDRELILLVSALVDGDIDASDFQRLNELMENDPAARELYIRMTHFHAELSEVALRAASPVEESPVEKSPVEDSAVEDSTAALLDPADRRPSWRRVLRRFAGAAKDEIWRRATQPKSISLTTAAIVVGLLITAMALVVIPAYQRSSTPAPYDAQPVVVARITRTLGAVWSEENAGQRASSNVVAGEQIALDSGLVEITFGAGARVLLHGPAVLRPVSAKASFLEQGRLTAVAPSQAKGFTVHSPCANLVDLGTEFGVDVQSNGTTDVNVFVGSVEVETLATAGNSARRLVLTEGEAVRVASSGGFRNAPQNADEYVRATALTKLLAEQKYERWREFSAKLKNDPSVVVLYTFEESDRESESLANRSSTQIGNFDGRIEGPAWTSGRWKEKGALQFRNVDDNVHLDFGAEQFNQLTLSAWVNLHQLPHTHNALLYSSDWSRAGAMHWTLLPDGRVEFALSGNVPPVIQSEPASLQYRRGQWVHLAVSYDAAEKRTRFYINGAPAGERRYTAAAPIEPRQVQMCNWSEAIRNLLGKVDELIVFRRALGAEEIREIYKAGMP